MEQNTHVTQDYRKMTIDAVRQNAFHFAVGSFIVIMTFVVLAIQYGAPILNIAMQGYERTKQNLLFSLQPSTNNNTAIVAESLKDRSINYISPTPRQNASGNLGIISEEDGQISAISSSQVTYQRNKYVIQQGESLQDVARKVYGDPDAWVRIAQANNISNPDYIEVGMELSIPR